MRKTCAPLRVLTYHRIDHCNGDPLRDRAELTVTPAEFEFQMNHIARHYNVVSLDDVLSAAEGDDQLPKHAVLVTFDDAYTNVGTYAWPIMKALGLPATIFLPTGVPNLPCRCFWWDKLRVAFSETEEPVLDDPELGSFTLASDEDRINTYKIFRDAVKTRPAPEANTLIENTYLRLGNPQMPNEAMDWNEITHLADDGVQFAPHSYSHPILTQLTPDALERELKQPLIDLDNKLGAAPPVIAYPSGYYNQQVVDMARSLGYKLGFTTELSNDRLHHKDHLMLGRISVSAKYSAPLFRTTLLPGGLDLVKGYKHAKEFKKKLFN